MKAYGYRRKTKCSVAKHGTRCVVADEVHRDQMNPKVRRKRARREAKKEIRSIDD